MVSISNAAEAAAVRVEVRQRVAARHPGGPRYHRPPYAAHGNLVAVARATERELLVEGPAGTGKSLAILSDFDRSAREHPGARLLVIRKTSTALAASGIVTYERDVLGGLLAARDVTFLGGSPRRATAYHYRNGSQLVVGGLDQPDKILSTDYDRIFAQEATELRLDDWETLTTRLRTGTGTVQQLVGDCNPAFPTHWLHQRAGLRVIRTTHQDNPRYWDEDAADWTDEGRRYVLGTLASLTGVRRERLFLGHWAAAEGAVYDTWDAQANVVDEPQLLSWGLIIGGRRADGTFALGRAARRVWFSQDWGFIHPGVLQVWLEDADGRLVRLHELYKTGELVDPWWTGECRRLAAAYHPQAVVCDPSEPGHIATYRRHGLPAVPANNDVLPGIQAVQARLPRAADGRPRLAVLRADPEGADPELRRSYQPWCLELEVESYAWNTTGGRRRGEEPIKDSDHACDAMRYATAQIDLKPRPGSWTTQLDGRQRHWTAGLR